MYRETMANRWTESPQTPSGKWVSRREFEGMITFPPAFDKAGLVFGHYCRQTTVAFCWEAGIRYGGGRETTRPSRCLLLVAA